MSQIDFGKALSGGDKPAPPADAGASWGALNADSPTGYVPPAKFRRSRLGRSEWANIIFTVVAVLGGLFCAFYFFNGAEVLRAGLTWPQEHLYALPGVSEPGNDSSLAPPNGKLPGTVKPTKSRPDSGDPFSRAGDPLSLNPTPSRVARADSGGATGRVREGLSTGLIGRAPDAGTVLHSLNPAAQEGDALKQTFDKAVSDLEGVAGKSNRERVAKAGRTVAQNARKHGTNNSPIVVKGARNSVSHPLRQRAPQAVALGPRIGSSPQTQLGRGIGNSSSMPNSGMATTQSLGPASSGVVVMGGGGHGGGVGGGGLGSVGGGVGLGGARGGPAGPGGSGGLGGQGPGLGGHGGNGHGGGH